MRDPERRPVGDDVVAPGDARAARPRARSPRRRRQHRRLVGRADELCEVEQILDESRRGMVVCEIVGPSGIGKTALVEEFVARAAHARGALVLTARCHPQEAVPFKALDGAIDELARHLARPARRRRLPGCCPGDIASARRIFPVLARVPRIARAIAPGGADVDPMQGRRDAFAALRMLLARIADERPVVLWIDDVQWGDLDSVDLLRELWRDARRARRSWCCSTYRADPQTPNQVLDALQGRIGGMLGPEKRRTVELGPLSRDGRRAPRARRARRRGGGRARRSRRGSPTSRRGARCSPWRWRTISAGAAARRRGRGAGTRRGSRRRWPSA